MRHTKLVVINLYLLVWFGSSCLNASPEPVRVSDYPHAYLTFESTKSYNIPFKDVNWSRSSNLVLQGWDIPNATFPLYLVDANKPGSVSPYLIEQEIIQGQNPILSPRGDKLVFWNSDILQVVDLIRMTQTEIVLPFEHQGALSWSPDGEQLGILNLETNKIITFYMVDLQGRVQKKTRNYRF